MKIAFTYNLMTAPTEEQAEFDSPTTVEAIRSSLVRLGHEVRCIDVSCPLSKLVHELNRFSPDLVFNTAEGHDGRFREAFYPAVFENLRLPYTGSDAFLCGITLDKYLTKLIVAEHGVPMARSVLVRELQELDGLSCDLPVLVKPNSEGSSIGITSASIVNDASQLVSRVDELLRRFPDGLLVEEYIPGRDLVVPFLEGVAPESGGVLEPATYVYRNREHSHGIYDLSLKMDGFSGLDVICPGDLTPAAKQRAMRLTRRIVQGLGIRDLARLDFRIDDDDEIFFLEINALPSLEEGASIYLGAKLAGLPTQDDVIGAVIRSACARHGLVAEPVQRRLGRATMPRRLH